jgi:hypothetical protein
MIPTELTLAGIVDAHVRGSKRAMPGIGKTDGRTVK